MISEMWTRQEAEDAIRVLARELRASAIAELYPEERWDPDDFLPCDWKAIRELALDADIDIDDATWIAWPVYADSIAHDREDER